ncbi:peptidyl-prolyl cis-trans isomerase [Streptomyces sp. NPDC087294]|uniref:peptidyl-prolyl cis-trans isomerase n=1 Tax=Streptomyces sp. NPDC087294 TaxID=3365777 RepID=UPI003814B16B
MSHPTDRTTPPATAGHPPPPPHPAPHPHPHPEPDAPAHAAVVAGRAVARERVDALLAAVPARDPESGRPESLARAERQRRRWATQVVVADELARRACRERGLAPPARDAPARLLAVAGSEVADLGSIVAAALAHSPSARALLAALEAAEEVPEADVADYYARNRDRYLTPDALRRGVDPFGRAAPDDFLPLASVREALAGELRRAAGRRAFFAWFDRARADVTYTPGHEHPGDPGHPDHEHRH